MRAIYRATKRPRYILAGTGLDGGTDDLIGCVLEFRRRSGVRCVRYSSSDRVPRQGTRAQAESVLAEELTTGRISFQIVRCLWYRVGGL